VQRSRTNWSDRDLIQLRSCSKRPMTSHALTAHQTAVSLWLEIFPLFCSLRWQCFGQLSGTFFSMMYPLEKQCKWTLSVQQKTSLTNSEILWLKNWKIIHETYPDEWDDTALGWLALTKRACTHVMKPTWCTIYLKFIQSLHLYVFRAC
jgi:hypothetical protein